MDYLRVRNKLDADFPSEKVGGFLCSLTMNAVVSSIRENFEGELSKNEALKADCVMKNFKEEGVIDDMILRDVVLTSNRLSDEKREEKFKAAQDKLKKKFEDAAKKCESDPSYAGLFDEILQIKNESLAVLTENYCTTTFVNESGLINLEDVDANPNNIGTTNINCDEIILNLRQQHEADVRKELKSENLGSKIDCIIQKQKDTKVFELVTALKVNNRVDNSLQHKKENVETLTNKIRNYGSAVVSCYYGK
jgi:hypothetical protein